MFNQKLRFYAAGDCLVANYARRAVHDQPRQFLGRKATTVTMPDGTVRHGFEHTGEVIEVMYLHEYVKDAKEGHLVPADDATAKICGVPKGGPPNMNTNNAHDEGDDEHV